MPTRRLPARPTIEHLAHQAQDLLEQRKAGDRHALQRIREFHPRYAGLADSAIRAAAFTLPDAHLTIAREYGFSRWARLSSYVTQAERSDRGRPHHERIEDPDLRRAVNLLDAGDLSGLRKHAADHPDLVRRRAVFEGENYFRDPTLLEFIAENPVRNGRLPANIVEIARMILDAGAKVDQRAVNSTLGLVSSGRVTREHRVQIPLIDLLCDYGADPGSALPAALGHGEFAAAALLIRRGAAVDLSTAAATGRREDARRLLPGASPDQRHRALAWAAQYGHVEIVRLLLEAGEDPSRYNPEGAHSHSTPLHQAALAGHLDVVRLLVDAGATGDVKDIHHQATALEWAEHGGQAGIAEFLRGRRRGGS